MSDPYTPFPASFPGFALVDALSVIKNGAVKTHAGQLQLAHAGWELAGWGLGATLGADKGMFAVSVNAQTLSNDEALKLLDQLSIASSSEPNDDGTHVMMACPISPATALKLAGWLLKAAEIIVPILL